MTFPFKDAQARKREFNPSRLALARRRRALSKKLLADQLQISVRSLSAFESGEFAPLGENIEAMSVALKFPESFFFGEDLEGLNTDIASFRALSKMSAGDRDAALAQGSIGHLLNEWLESRFVLPLPDLPEIDHEPNWTEANDIEDGRLAHAEAAAVQVRNHWALGEMPIGNVIHLLEAKGVRVFSLAVDCLEVDAFSHWKSGRPFVFLNVMKSAEHSRFDAAHELGHLVMHRHAIPHGRAAEREADAFASAFLMPRGSLAAHSHYPLIPKNLISAKQNWKVSVAALNYRLHTLGSISDWQYRANCIEIAKRGWRTNEPEPIARETSQVLAKVLRMLHDEGTNRVDIARSLDIYVEELEQLLFGLVISLSPDLRGPRTVSRSVPAKLHLVR